MAALHHRKFVVVNVGIRGASAQREMAALVRISEEIAPIDGTRVLMFPSDEYE